MRFKVVATKLDFNGRVVATQLMETTDCMNAIRHAGKVSVHLADTIISVWDMHEKSPIYMVSGSQVLTQ